MKVVSSQTAAGLIIVLAGSGFLMWMATSWYGMEIGGLTTVWLFLWLAGTAFFLLQSSMLNLNGLPAERDVLRRHERFIRKLYRTVVAYGNLLGITAFFGISAKFGVEQISGQRTP